MEKMEEALSEIPGATTEFSQPIQMRFNELMTGVRSDVAIKIFGEDLGMLVSKGDEVLQLVSKVEGVADAKAERVAGLPQITVRYNKDKLALYGLNVGDLNRVIRVGFAGEAAGVVYEGEKRFDMVVRLASGSRADIANLKTLFVPLPSGNQIPLEQVADIDYEPGPMQISREDGKRRIVIGFNVRGRDVESVVEEIRAELDKSLSLPAGYYVTYGGQFENLVDANKRLSVAVPVALLLIFILLFLTFRSMKQSFLIFTAIPFSAIGGVFALWLRDMPFSISAGVGFIALFGVAVLNGIVLIGYFNQLKAEGMEDVLSRIEEGTKVRLRPVVMTASVASLGFLPMAISTGAGAEVQKPLATVVIGGLITATLLTLVVLPILYYYSEQGVKGLKKLFSIAASAAGMLLLAINMQAQNPATLDLPTAIDMGLKNNPQVQAAVLETQEQMALRGTAVALPKTTIGMMLGQYNTRAFDQNYSISQGFSPFQYGVNRQLLNANVQGSEFAAGMTRQQVTFEIRQSWNAIQYLKRLNRLFMQQDSLLQGFVSAASLKFQTGETNLLEKTTAVSKREELLQRIMQGEAAVRVEQARLLALIGGKAPFLIPESDFVPLQVAALQDSARLRQNPALLYAMHQVQVATASQRVDKAAILPEFSAGYFIQSLTGSQEVNGQAVFYNGAPRFQGFIGTVSIPIFAGSYIAKAKAAEIDIQVQQKNADYLQTQLASQFQQQLQQLASFESLIGYYETTALPNAKVISTNATRGYQNGDVSYVEYLQGLQTALEIQTNYLQAINNFNQAAINLQYLSNL